MNLPEIPTGYHATETALSDSLLWASSTERPWVVLEWASRLHWAQGKVFWEVINEEWPSFDLIPHKQFEKAFRHFKLFAPREGIPPRVTVYRGQSKNAPLGLSWTTSRAVAESFARGHRGIKPLCPVIHSLEVIGKQIAFLCDDRQESEIVLFNIPRSKSKLSTVEAPQHER
jgi:hypothetical protein